MPALTNEVVNGATHEIDNGTHATPKNEIANSHGEENGRTNGQDNGAKSSASPHPRLTRSIFTPVCHPFVEEVIRDVHGYYLQHWGFRSEEAKQKFVAAGFSWVTCLYYPKALDDRIRYACSLLTILFLIDDQLEQMSLADGKAYNDSLKPLCRGDVLPDRAVPVQWIMYDVWEDMRKCDKQLADEVLEPVFLFMRAQTASERLSFQGLGAYLQYRRHDIGQVLLAALMRFVMGVHLSAADHASVIEIERNCGRHISVVNDIYSFEKELQASKTAHKEGGMLCSAVSIFAAETGLGVSAAKRALYVLVREWEAVHRELVKARLDAEGGCGENLRVYMEGLEYHMSGNELWSSTTKRYGGVGVPCEWE